MKTAIDLIRYLKNCPKCEERTELINGLKAHVKAKCNGNWNAVEIRCTVEQYPETIRKRAEELCLLTNVEKGKYIVGNVEK